MRIKNILLLVKTLLKSTSITNKIKYTKDKKKKKKIIGNLIAYIILFVYVFAICVFMGYGYSVVGLIDYLPMLSVVMVSSLAFIFTFFKANSYLLDFKTKDYILSLPFSIKEVVISRFFYMYIKGLWLQLIFILGFITSYVIYAKTTVLFVAAWFVLALVVPLIPTAISAFIGMFVGKITSRFKFKKMLQVVITFAIIGTSMFSSYITQTIMENSDTSEIIGAITDKVDLLTRYFSPAIWVNDILYSYDIISLLMLIVSVVVSIYAFTVFTSRIFLRVTTNLQTTHKSKKGKNFEYRKRSILQTIVFKEFKRMIGSTNYLVNNGFGMVFALILTVLCLILGGDKVVTLFTSGQPVPKEYIILIIPFFIYLFVGMTSTTTCSPSLEGKNYWIVQSLPISKKQLYKGKMLFNILLTLPIALISSFIITLSFKASVFEIIQVLVLESILVLFSTFFGLITGDKFIKLDFENDMEVVKQSAAVGIYLFVNMFLTIAMGFLVVYLKIITTISIVLLVPMAIYLLLCVICLFVINKFCC